METLIKYHEPKELKAEMMEMAELTSTLVISITDEEMREMAGNQIAKWNDVEKRWIAYWKDAKESAFQTHKLIKGMENEYLVVIDANRKPLNKGVSDYLMEKKRIEEAERRRIELENAAIKDAAEKRLLDQAAKAEAKGQTEKAETLLEAANQLYIEPTVITPQAPRKIELEGGGTQGAKEDCDVEITDPKLFLNSVMARLQNAPFSMIEIKLKLNPAKAWINSEKVKSFPGLSIIPKMTLSTRKK